MMTHKQFLEMLKAYGLEVKIDSWQDFGSSAYRLTVNDVPVSIGDYQAFGYYSSGTYAQCNRTHLEEFTEEVDVVIAIQSAFKTLTEHIQRQDSGIFYVDVLALLVRIHNQKRSEAEVAAIKRVLFILHDNEQVMFRTKKEENKQ